jgi:regulatory protein
MAGVITALKIQKKNKERVNVFIDDEFALGITVMVATTLRKGQFLSDAEIEQLKYGDERNKAYDRAVRFLSYRSRSVEEVNRYLREKDYPDAVINDTVDRLLEQRYLDDEEYARAWLRNREQLSPKGRQALRYELRQKGVSDRIIDTVLANLNEDELAWAAVENKLSRWQNLPEQEFKKKLVGFLNRRGFSYTIANDVFDRAWNETNLSE